MEYPNDTTSDIITSETDIITSKTLKKCNCNFHGFYFCFCNGEDKLLDELKMIGMGNLMMWTHIFAAQNGHLNILKWFEQEHYIWSSIDHEINIHCLEYLFEINKTFIVKNEINLQQIERLKILASGVF